MPIRLSTRVVLLCIAPLLFTGCGPGAPRDAVVGTWESGLANKKRAMTFWDNGVWSYKSGDLKYTGQYKFLDEDTVEIKVDVPSGSKPILFKRKLSFSHHDKMNTTDPDSLRRTTWLRSES